LDLAFLAGLSGADILVAVVADVVMVLTGLFAGISTNKSASWGYYAMACIAYLVIVYQLAFNGRQTVAAKDTKTATFFTSIAGFTLLLWTAYPMCVSLQLRL
jgi:bacteriorhodopsin